MPVDLVPPLPLRDHHERALARVRERVAADPSAIGLLLAGSIAHGFASEYADVDVLVIVTHDEYTRRAAAGRLAAASADDTDYPGGYVDAKYLDLELLGDIAARGSEPARFAFQDARIVLDDTGELPTRLAEIVRYPSEGVDDRTERFCAQLLAWRWYHTQALDKQSRYLELLSLQKLVLFTCRVVLAENRMLYPFHKWMLRVTESAARRPDELMASIDELLAGPEHEVVDRHVRTVIRFAGHDPDELDRRWGNFFLHDTEMTWRRDATPIDDL